MEVGRRFERERIADRDGHHAACTQVIRRAGSDVM